MIADRVIFGDIEGKLDVLNIECTKCARKGRYHDRKLIGKAPGEVDRPGPPASPLVNLRGVRFEGGAAINMLRRFVCSI